jgi:hypothetical protein
LKRHLSLGPKVLAVVLAFLFCVLLSVEARSEEVVAVSKALVHVSDSHGDNALGLWPVAGANLLLCYGLLDTLPQVICLRTTGEKGAHGLAMVEKVVTFVVTESKASLSSQEP